MTSYIIVSIIGGILFAVPDGLINANPLATKLFEVYKPIARSSVNFMAGIIIDLAARMRDEPGIGGRVCPRNE